MNIGFDAAAMFCPGSKNRGIGNYSVSLFSTLINSDKENNYFMLNCIEDTSFNTYLNDNVTNFTEDILFTGRGCSFIKDDTTGDYSEIYGDIIRTFIEKYKIDIFIVTSPFEFYIAAYKKEWFGNAKVYCIVYDLIPYVMKDHYLTEPNINKMYHEHLDKLKDYDRYLVISQSVKDDMVSYLGYDPEKIDVIYGAFDAHFRQIEISDSEKNALFKKFGIKDNYIMCTGGDDYRKNIDGLIEAYAGLPRSLIDKYQLVIVCKMSVPSIEKYTALAKKYKVEDRVILTNFVSTEELIQFYNLAHLMAFPSKYEGFGLPVVEAWECGTPVLTANNSSLGEIAGEGAVKVDPFNIKDITKGLEYALTEADLSKMLEIGKQRNKELFNWNTVAYLTLEALLKTDITSKIDTTRKKIAFFTPLSPIQSGISDYSEDIIRMLSKWIDIDVFIDDKYKATYEFNDSVNIYNHKEYVSKASEYYDTIYQVGNSDYHVYMYDYIEKYSGTVVLHDFNMNGIAFYLNSIDKRYIYKKFVINDYFPDEVNTILTYGPHPDKPFNGIAVTPANRVIVHDKFSKRGLLERNFGKKIFVIPHYAKPGIIPEETLSIREKYGFAADDIIFSAFGIIAPSKRIMPLVKAFKDITESEPNAKLLLCGKQIDSMGTELNDFIKENNMQDKIRITGYIEIEDFVNYIDICDVCFNLRYPYNGESSGSLARILAKGKPVVVNKIGSFDSVPNNACIKLKNVADMSEKEEIECIYEVMRKYIDEPESFRELGMNGRKYAEDDLDLNKVAKQYLDAILSTQRKAITREIARDIKNNIHGNNYTIYEIEALAHTFAYAKNEL